MVQVLDGARVVDELGPGDTVGHLSVLSGLRLSQTIKATTDTLLYLLPDPRPVLAHPERLTFRPRGGVRSLLSGAADYGLRPVTEFMREPLWCRPDTTIREAARAMTDARQSCVLVDLPGGLGIMTDSDCRRHVATGEVPVDAPLSVITTSPVRSIDHADPAAMAFLMMVQHGVHHLVVNDDDGRAIGVCRVVDLSNADVRDPLAVRATIDAADTVDDLAIAAAAIRPDGRRAVRRGSAAAAGRGPGQRAGRGGGGAVHRLGGAVRVRGRGVRLAVPRLARPARAAAGLRRGHGAGVARPGVRTTDPRRCAPPPTRCSSWSSGAGWSAAPTARTPTTRCSTGPSTSG